MPRSILAVAVAVPLLLVGCGSDSAESTPSAEPSATAAASPAGDATTVDGVTVTGAPDSEPTIAIEEGATPPPELVVEEITPGTGKEVGPNSLVTVQYVGTAWSTGQVFDSSWATGELQFPIKGVITGWQEGLVGKTAGSRVLLVVPPAQAYPDGRETPKPTLAAGQTLVYVVDILDVAPAAG